MTLNAEGGGLHHGAQEPYHPKGPDNLHFLRDDDKSVRPLGSHEQLLYSVVEVSQILCLGRTKVYELLYAGELASVKIGALRRVRRSDLEVFVRNLEQEI